MGRRTADFRDPDSRGRIGPPTRLGPLETGRAAGMADPSAELDRMADNDFTVTQQPDGTFHVEIRGPSGTTDHIVTIPDGLVTDLGWQGGDAELVRASFEFLLDREPASSILSRFRLDVIGRYFPDYQQEMRRLAGA